MKKRKLVKGLGVGAALSGMLFGAGCRPQCVYGPPPDDTAVEDTQPAETETFEPGIMNTETVYGPPAQETSTFDPAEMEIEDVYGPPPEEAPATEAASRANRETMESENAPQREAEQENEAAAQAPFDPTEMQIEPAYGPPPEDYQFPAEETP